MGKASELARMCKVLSVETRVEILELVKDRAVCVGAIAARLDVTQGAVSQHLRILRDAGLVAAEKRGYFVHYRLNKKMVNRWKGMISKLAVTEKSQFRCVKLLKHKSKG
ncbi:MAG TPA: metalloregulator ArsR/SmtB family transcription factor [Sedimentisphaerales bacterium]|nr:metalloregulator ArsR/SmtB family transcription factor [Sedimentisphaerales bacterium]